ncbi:MAG: hypothetical protein HC860_07740 [Alkalinema sp. RU_4_3]|nr:hypothetical protein [Alkalinema sp. RU_4_3]
MGSNLVITGLIIAISIGIALALEQVLVLLGKLWSSSASYLNQGEGR